MPVLTSLKGTGGLSQVPRTEVSAVVRVVPYTCLDGSLTSYRSHFMVLLKTFKA
jgi:hypothetical protein